MLFRSFEAISKQESSSWDRKRTSLLCTLRYNQPHHDPQLELELDSSHEGEAVRVYLKHNYGGWDANWTTVEDFEVFPSRDAMSQSIKRKADEILEGIILRQQEQM